MERYNNGLIYTNDKCIACNKCINQCSILGANVSIYNDKTARIKVDSRKCNDCGKCITLCTQNARNYRDDSELFFAALKSGRKMSAIIAPSFSYLYEGKVEKIIGYLKSQGIEKVYDAGFGAEISIWATVKYLKEAKQLPVEKRAFITNACPALVNVIEKYHPFLIPKMIPVHSPMMCTAIYAHKYLGDKNDFVFIGPCIAKKDEINSPSTTGNVKYNVTFENLIKNIPASEYENCSGKFDLTAFNYGKMLPKSGSMSKSISYFFPRSETVLNYIGFSKENTDNLYRALNAKVEESFPLVAELLACKEGCINGPGKGSEIPDSDVIISKIAKTKREVYKESDQTVDAEKLWSLVTNDFKDIISDDFKREYSNRSKQPYKVPDYAYNTIFEDMLKDTPEKRNLNCGSCGFNSCKEMATAIACGYNIKENCIHYMNDLMMQRLMSDQETGLMSRVAFLNTADDLILNNQDKEYIFVVGDINKLRIINDLYSFNVGNGVLKMIGAILKQISGEAGLIARLGGGMFAMCFENSVENIQKLRQLKVFDCSSIGITFPVTMRFGLYMFEPNDNAVKALDCASLCMDKKISNIQNTFTVFTRELRENMYKEAEITSKMQKALDNDEFKLWYQPQYSALSGKLVGAEALCRWIEKDGNIISPGVFIPIAEKNGFIRELDKRIWRIAFSKVKEWLDKGLSIVPISLNISRISLETDAFIYVIKRLKDEFKIPTEYIHFEITESAYISEDDSLSERIEQIKELGYKIAMDDFGSGYSSLNVLKDLEFDILKLDMGFVRGKNNTEKGSAIINYVIRMAQSLNLNTVAEGVELQEQADFLREIGVNTIQGYLYAKPMPEKDFEKLF